MTHDFAILHDGTTKSIDDFAPGTLLIACQRRQIARIVHVSAPRSRSTGAFRQSKPRELTASQVRCIEGSA